MTLFITVNLQVTDAFGNSNIVAACLDLHPNLIQEVINGHDGNVNVILKSGRLYVIMMPFTEFMGILSSQVNVISNFKEEVQEYLPNNWEAYKEHIKRNKDGGEKSTT